MLSERIISYMFVVTIWYIHNNIVTYVLLLFAILIWNVEKKWSNVIKWGRNQAPER